MEKHYEIPANYMNKLFLTALDIKKIVGIGENKTYGFLKETLFRVIKVGIQYRVVATSFWNWYFEEEEMD